jgi:23S rRNA-/tRNA-specific pseudouridylate synthase
MDRLKQPVPIAYRDENWFIVNKPYDCRIQEYPGRTDPSGKPTYMTLQTVVLIDL